MSRPTTQRNAHLFEDAESFCTYSLRPCYRLRSGNHSLCEEHLLEEKTKGLSFQRCAYQLSGQSCLEIVHHPRRFCSAHDANIAKLSQVPTVDRADPQTPTSLLRDLRKSLTSLATAPVAELSMSDPNHLPHLTQVPVPIHHYPPTALQDCNLNCDTDSDSEGEDADTFPYTGQILTPPEVVTATKRSLEILKQAYRDELLRLQRELRLGYEKFSSQRKKQKLSRSLRHPYAHCYTHRLKERWMRHKATEKRYQAAYIEHLKVPPTRRCIFQGTVKCYERCLPLSQFCAKHIQEDDKQVLFKKCLKEKCSAPVIAWSLDASCPQHSDINHQLLPEDILEEIEEKMKEESPYEVIVPPPSSRKTPGKIPPSSSFTGVEESNRPGVEFADMDLDFPVSSFSCDINALLRDSELQNLLNSSTFPLLPPDKDGDEMNPDGSDTTSLVLSHDPQGFGDNQDSDLTLVGPDIVCTEIVETGEEFDMCQLEDIPSSSIQLCDMNEEAKIESPAVVGSDPSVPVDSSTSGDVVVQPQTDESKPNGIGDSKEREVVQALMMLTGESSSS